MKERFQIGKDVLVTEVDGEPVLLLMTTGRYYELNEVGRRAWFLLTAGNDLKETCRILATEFDAPVNVILRDTDAWLDELLRLGILVRSTTEA